METIASDHRTTSILEAPPGAPSDARVRDLERLVDSGQFDLLSLDVFDTLVWRQAPTPVDVFFLLGAALRARGALRASSSLESFVRERVGAEKRARRFERSGEVTLAEIYAEFPSGYLERLAPRELPALEFEIERGIVRTHPPMRDLLARARAAGMKTALVSDTYFDRKQIQTLAGVDVDHVIVSSEHRLGKHEGLHRFLIEAGGVAPHRILHVGDNFAADVEGPEVFDIARYWFRKLPDEYRGVIESELPGPYGARAPYVVENDRGITALRGRTQFECENPYERWGAGILGPIVAGFGDWVIARCRELSIGHALCLMREGRLLKQILDLGGSGLESRELFASRLVARQAALYDASEPELRQFLFRPTPQRRGGILEQLGLDRFDLGDPEERLAPDQVLALIERLARDPARRRRIVESSARARAGLLAHLDGIWGATRPSRVAVVDLGYRGTIQECLQKIFDRERHPVTTHGLYLVTGGKVHLTQATGCAVEGWLAENGHPISMAHTFMRSPEIIEQSLMADCGTTLAHTARGEPVLDEVRTPEEQRAQIRSVQRGVLRYARRWAEHRAAHGIEDAARLVPLHRAICARSVARPLPVELELFGAWKHDENFGSEATRTLTEVVDLHEWERSHLSAHQIASLPHRRVLWPFGFARGLSENLGEAVAHIYLRTAPPETFDSGHAPRCFTFLWDSGNGFDAEHASLQEFRINSRGRVWHRISLAVNGETHFRYGFMLGAPGELIALTGIRLALRPRAGAARAIEHRPESIEAIGYRPLTGKLLIVERSPALLTIPAPDLSGFAGEIDIDLFFALHPET